MAAEWPDSLHLQVLRHLGSSEEVWGYLPYGLLCRACRLATALPCLWRRLDFTDAPVEQPWRLLHQHQEVQQLILRGLPLEDKILQELLAKLPELELLDLGRCCELTPSCASSLALPKLQSLSLDGMATLEDTHVRQLLEHCPKLSRLDLRFCERLSDVSCFMHSSGRRRGLKTWPVELFNLRQLESLDVSQGIPAPRRSGCRDQQIRRTERITPAGGPQQRQRRSVTGRRMKRHSVSEPRPAGTLPGDVGLPCREESEDASRISQDSRTSSPFFSEFQNLLNQLVARHLEEVVEVRAENAALRARCLSEKPESKVTPRETAPEAKNSPTAQEPGATVVEHVFTVIFTIDVVVRIACLKWSFWKSAMNWSLGSEQDPPRIDVVVVTLTIATIFLDMSSLPIDPLFFRLLRLGKLARAFRMIILSGRLESFGLLLKCVVASVTMLGYATLVLIFVQCVCGMIISTLVSRYLEDPTMDKEARRYVFQYWGTFTRTFLTMFEVLFANWAPSCRSLVDNVSEWFSLIFVAYRCIVGFALLNVVNSVFVSQTLKIADSDEEYLIKVRQKSQAQYRKKLENLFQAADVTNDGFLTMDEFMRLLEDEKMHLWLSQLQLEYHDLMELFDMIDSGDGRIDWKEFMDGAGRLKGQAKSMDVFRLETKVATLRSLRSLVLDGNPCAAALSPAQLRQLARPGRVPGQTPAQVISGYLNPSPAPPAHDARPTPSFTGASPSFVADFEDDAPLPSPPPPPQEMWGATHRWMGFKRDCPSAQHLRARVAELERAAVSTDGSALRATEGAASGKPSWLSDRGSLAATLPSRRGLGALNQEDEAGDLRNQLKEEQRRSKRLEQQVQRLTDRLSEQSMTGSSKGSLPHFEMAEVQLGEILNQGGFSVVHKGSWHGTKVAVKKLFDPNISHELLAEFDNEVQKLEMLRHPNILMPLALHRKPPALCLIMELVDGGSYFQLLHAPHQFASASGPLSLGFQEHLNILDPSATALAFLHARGIAHRDIKSHNVLLSPHLEVKLCDFGLSRLKSELMTGALQFAGTPSYMAPEVFRNAKYTEWAEWAESVDVFAFGTLLWEAMSHDIPFANLDPADIRDRVIEGQMLEMPSTCPREMQQLIRCSVLKQLRAMKEGPK
eukprot:g8064.t2